MLVICINDKDKPAEIPSSAWVKKDRVYTAINYMYHPIQNCYSLLLEEITPPPPYIGYKSDRFEPVEETPSERWEELLNPVENAV
jgi:hypothetical protein